MAQIIIRNLDDATKAQFAAQARLQGLSMEELARQVIARSAQQQPVADGIGSQMAALFADCGLDEPLELPPREPLAEPRVRFDDHS